jgi:hypothetical protein
MNIQKFLSCIILTFLLSCNSMINETKISSPDGINTIDFFLSGDGSPGYLVKHNNSVIIDSSFMSFDFLDQPSLKDDIKIIGSSLSSIDEVWIMPWGEQRLVENKYNQLKVELEEVENPSRKFNVYFRAYNDGIGFRYEFLQHDDIDSIFIIDENTEFQLTGDHLTWWTPGDWDIYEHLYKTTKVSEIDAIQYRNNENLAQTYIPYNAVNTPVTMRTKNGVHLSFHEANLTDYAGMTLKVDKKKLKLTCGLVGSKRNAYKVKRKLPFKTPWRTIQIAKNAKELIQSNLIVNLNEPNTLEDITWFNPMKYIGIWWEMHIGKSTWDLASGRHGATTENAKRYIDFAAANGIGGVLVEGWNTGWENWIGVEDREGIFDFVTPYEDYDLEEVVKYARARGAEIIMHHETSAAPRTYEQQLDSAFTLMKELGIHLVKTGYVGKIIPEGEFHHGQWMVNHYRKVLETAAKYNVAVNAHEPIKDTGLRRTYPNAISREGLRGQEFNAWASDGGNPPEHLSIVAFTRMLAGPIDFTPGVFDISLPTKPDNHVNTTLAHQLALYVVIYSPIQMACDLPDNYENQPAFQFIKDVGVDWEQSIVIDGEVGDFVVIAREERETGNWFVGGITDENKREINISFDFLKKDTQYKALVYKDGQGAHYQFNPLDIEIAESIFTKKSNMKISLAEGGGFAISLVMQK